MKKLLLSIITISTFGAMAQIADFPISSASTTITAGQSATIDLSETEIGVDYYLRNGNNVSVDGPFSGTGGALSFNTGILAATDSFYVFGSSTQSVGLKFDGQNDKLNTNYSLPLTNNFTIEAWIYPQANTYKKVISSYSGTGGIQTGEIIIDTYGAGTTNNGRGLRARISGNGGFTDYAVSDVLTLDTWNHIALTYDLGTAIFYVDGVQVGTTTGSTTQIPDMGYAFTLGEDRVSTGVSEFFEGKMDDVRIWDTVRTAAEISANMMACLTGSEIGLGAYYKFNDSSGPLAADELGLSDADLVGMDTITNWSVVGSASIPCGINSSYEMQQKLTITVVTCTVNIPDANFKAYLVGNTAINTNGDTEIQCSEATAFTGQISCNNLNISDLTGIEAFTALTDLRCWVNNLTSLDITQNINLTALDCGTNLLNTLDVSNNIALTSLTCNNNLLITLDVSNNTALTWLAPSFNSLTLLDVSSNTLLVNLNCRDNLLTSLDISVNTSIDEFYCHNNQLTSLNVANGNNLNFTFFYATNNPSLTCIQVDDDIWSTTNWTNIDATASFSTTCGAVIGCTVNIPDANFKAYLVGNTAINTNSDTEIQCSEASAFTGEISCYNLSISDLTGIEAFTSLTQLQCQNNSLSALNVAQNTALISLRCNNNSIATFDVTQLSALLQLYCYNNSLTTLSVTQNTVLTILHCYSNSISILDVTQNTVLTQLQCQDNSISTLDVTQNTALTELLCWANQINSLDASQNSVLTQLRCQNNSLTALNVANGNNTSFISNLFNATGNANLTCIQVDDATWSTTNWLNIDSTSSYSVNCSGTGTGLEEISTVDFSIYPNPAKNVLNVEGVENIEKMSVYGINGKLINTYVGNSEINVSELTTGIYIIEIQTANGIAHSRFIKE